MPGPVTCELVARETVSRIAGAALPDVRGHLGASSTAGFSGSNGSCAPPDAWNSESFLRYSARSGPIRSACEELQPVRLLVLVIAELVKDAHDRLGDVEDLASRKKVVHRLGGLDHDRRAAADHDAESAPPSFTAAR